MIQFVFAEVFNFSFKSKELPPELDLVRALPALRHPVVALGYEEKVSGQTDPGRAGILSGVQAMFTPGHTQEHACLVVTAGNKSMCRIGDFSHHPVLLFFCSLSGREVNSSMTLIRCRPRDAGEGSGHAIKGEEDCLTAVTFPGLASVISPKRRTEFDLFRKLPSGFPNDRVVHPFIRRLRPVPNGVLQLIYIFGDA